MNPVSFLVEHNRDDPHVLEISVCIQDQVVCILPLDAEDILRLLTAVVSSQQLEEPILARMYEVVLEQLLVLES